MFMQQSFNSSPENSSSSRQKAVLTRGDAPWRDYAHTRDHSGSSFELKEQHSKRNSFFSKRPKSTMTSSSQDSFARSHHSVLGLDDVPRHSSILESTDAPAETESSRSRFLFGRKRKSRTSLAATARASSSVDADDESDLQREETEGLKSDPSRNMRISAPWGFQHVAKIEKEPVDGREDNASVFENFRALRKGHRNAIIAPPADFDDPEQPNMTRSRRPPPLRPRRPDEQSVDEQLLSPYSDTRLRATKSVEAFLPPRTASMAMPSTPWSPPKRPLAPHGAPHHNDFASYGETNSKAMPMIQLPGPADEWERLFSIYDGQGSAMVHEIDAPYDHTRLPGFNHPLEKVLEEPEPAASNRQSRELPLPQALRHARSSPAISLNSILPGLNPKADDIPPTPSTRRITQRPLSQNSQGSDTLGDISSISREHQQSQKSPPCQFSKHNLGDNRKESSWEDDVDYCYDHAAEADCEFDWQGISRFDDNDSDECQSWTGPHSSYDSSVQAKKKQSHSMTTVASLEGDLYHLPNKVYQVPSKESVPELELRPTPSPATNSFSASTPKDGFDFKANDGMLHKLSIENVQSSECLPTDPLPGASQDGIIHVSDDEMLIARALNSTVPELPPRSGARMERSKTAQTAKVGQQNLHAAQLLPTPPPSVNQSPVIPLENEEKPRKSRPKKLSVDVIVAQLRGPLDLDSPVTPDKLRSPIVRPPTPGGKVHRSSAKKLSDQEIAQLFPQSLPKLNGASNKRLHDISTNPSILPPTSMPRRISNESVVTAIPVSRLPTPPKTPIPTSKSSLRSRLEQGLPPPPPQSASPAPVLPPVTDLSSSTMFPYLEPSRSAPLPARNRAESAAGRLGILPSPVSSYDSPISPDLLGPHPASSSRQSYSLFPAARRPPKPLDLRPVLSNENVPPAPKSAGFTGYGMRMQVPQPPQGYYFSGFRTR